jgi:hypothetical protein
MDRFTMFALLLAAAAISSVHAATCPPQGFDSVKDFDLKKYIQGQWFIQDQVSSVQESSNPWNKRRPNHSVRSSLCCLAALIAADDHCLSTRKPAVLCQGAVRAQRPQ